MSLALSSCFLLLTVAAASDLSPVEPALEKAQPNLQIRFVNAASTVGPIDLYLPSAGNAGLPATPSVPALAFKSATTYFTFNGTSVQLCANPVGVPPTLLLA